MKTLLQLVIATLLSWSLATGALAHGPTPQKVEEKVVVAAAPEAVWSLIKDFDHIAAWHPGVEKCEGQGGNSQGATRILTLKSGGMLTDGLDDYNEAEKSYAYRLAKENIEAFPVSFYSAAIAVRAAGSGSEVEWIGRFYRADTGNFPPENLNDEAAVKAMTAFLRQGLEGLKAKLEAKG